MPKAEVTLKITPTELAIIIAALSAYATTLARIEAKDSNRELPPFDTATLLYATEPFDGQQRVNRLLRDLA